MTNRRLDAIKIGVSHTDGDVTSHNGRVVFGYKGTGLKEASSCEAKHSSRRSKQQQTNVVEVSWEEGEHNHERGAAKKSDAIVDAQFVSFRYEANFVTGETGQNFDRELCQRWQCR